MQLSEDMKRVVLEQRLGFVATVTPDGRPNLSPKGTTTVLDDERLLFEDILSSEEEHIDYLETQLSLMKGLGEQEYLSLQVAHA